jgi:hypothetical protein
VDLCGKQYNNVCTAAPPALKANFKFQAGAHSVEVYSSCCGVLPSNGGQVHMLQQITGCERDVGCGMWVSCKCAFCSNCICACAASAGVHAVALQCDGV